VVSILPIEGGRQRLRGDPGHPGRRRAEQEAIDAAVTALYAEHALALTRLAQVILGDPAAAEDAVQEAFA
jgi:predicted RNase H-like nuclease